MSKANDERMWLLKRCWGRMPGWTNPVGFSGVKKWDVYIAKMVKDGLLEKDPELKLWRITEAGEKALAAYGNQ